MDMNRCICTTDIIYTDTDAKARKAKQQEKYSNAVMVMDAAALDESCKQWKIKQRDHAGSSG
jgi:hypothetical protein